MISQTLTLLCSIDLATIVSFEMRAVKSSLVPKRKTGCSELNFQRDKVYIEVGGDTIA